MFRKLIVVSTLALAACSTAQVASTTSAISVACQEALPLASLAVAIPTIGPFVAAGVQVGCATDAGIARLASDPSSATWLGQQIQILKSALGRS